jgi:hypothetical protein
VTTAELYAVYCRAYAEFDRDLDSRMNALRAASPVEIAIAAFAAEDAENGTPLRSREQFERSVASGLDALRPLGLRAA